MNILQILPELNVGGVETGTVDLAIARAQRLTVLDLPPVLWSDMVEAAGSTPDALNDLRLMIVGSDVMPVSTLMEWRRRFRSG